MTINYRLITNLDPNDIGKIHRDIISSELIGFYNHFLAKHLLSKNRRMKTWANVINYYGMFHGMKSLILMMIYPTLVKGSNYPPLLDNFKQEILTMHSRIPQFLSFSTRREIQPFLPLYGRTLFDECKDIFMKYKYLLGTSDLSSYAPKRGYDVNLLNSLGKYTLKLAKILQTSKELRNLNNYQHYIILAQDWEKFSLVFVPSPDSKFTNFKGGFENFTRAFHKDVGRFLNFLGEIYLQFLNIHETQIYFGELLFRHDEWFRIFNSSIETEKLNFTCEYAILYRTFVSLFHKRYEDDSTNFTTGFKYSPEKSVVFETFQKHIKSYNEIFNRKTEIV